MEISAYLPFWDKLTEKQQQLLTDGTCVRHFKKDAILRGGTKDCSGLLLPIKGELRVYILSDEGRELTLYRLFERDICLFSISHILRDFPFDVMMSAEQDTTLFHVPADLYERLMEQSVVVANDFSRRMSARLVDMIWLIDQILNQKLDTRLAAFLLEESRLVGSAQLPITHERIAHHLGSVREMITRTLKYFQSEHLVNLTRGHIQLLDTERLKQLAATSIR